MWTWTENAKFIQSLDLRKKYFKIFAFKNDVKKE